MNRAAAIAMALALGVVGCSGAPLPTDFSRAQSLETSDPAQARRIYAAVSERCKTTTLAHDDCALAAVRTAELDEADEHWRAAYDGWLRAAAISHQPTTIARALVRAGALAHERLGDDGGAAALAWRCVERYPDEIAAGDALALAIRVDEPRGWEALSAHLERLAATLRSDDVGDNLVYERGLLLARHGEAPEAVALFDALADGWPHSSLRDDGLWRAAGLLRARGDFQGALARLRRILSTRKDALVTGSYNYLQLDDAQLLLGQIYLDDLHDAAHAAEAFTTLADDYPESVLRDDALLELARARVAQHDTAGACRALGRLLRQFPDGNRVRAARARQTELGCSQRAGGAMTGHAARP